MNQRKSPYICHLFICVKSRGGERKSCGDHIGPQLKFMLKEAVKNQGWRGKVRVSDAGCLGVCESGPNIMIQPQGIWLSNVSKSDVQDIIELVGDILNETL
jgi:(2Fe-2S) ferredoxin